MIDLSSLNQYLTVSKFKMETPKSVRTSLRQGEWVTSIDLSDAYLHIPVHPQSRKFLRFHHKETLYQFTSLPFGLATAPLVFTLLVKEVKLLALKQDIRLHQYLDDWLIRASSQDEARKHTVKLLSLIQNLGFIVNLRKSELNPQQRFAFIGYHFLLDQGLVRPTNDRWNKIQISFNRISKKSVLSARTLMSTIGENSKIGQDTHETFPMAPQDPLEIPNASEFSNSLDSENETTREMVATPPKCSKWRILTPERSRHSNLYRRIKRRLGRALKSRLHRRHMVSGRKQLHINVLELKAVILALRHFSQQCNKKQVLVASDNTTVVAHINKQGRTHSPELCALMWRLLTWCNKNQITLRARHIPGSLNVIAEGLSRRNQIQHTEWSLAPQIFKKISLLWERPQIDLFATNLNTKLPTYVSPIPDQQAWAVDALNISWKNMISYTFPPTALLPRVVQKLLSQECRLILIAPGWPTKLWFWDLVELSLDLPRQLPPIRSLLKQPLNNQFHAHSESLNLHAWYPVSSILQNQGFSA